MTYNFTPATNFGPRLNDLPIFDCTFTQVTREWMNFQKGYCSAYELDFARCASRVGAVNAMRDCRKYMEDMQECAYHRKSLERYKIMQAERKKQGKSYMPPPPKDSVVTWYPQIS
ncbi:hypothetical protein LSH36_209g05057 [Paralvinella palmiformis]|uniref:NADH dehydrogenase [ubiquinone] iron-sulfur protein 5 n=1 Tax=Paralvinella palmiformis TaxID=53620 RepID=A0AAD9JPK3_9ANNE|nr:hypothetical protein LSH36_209g05057 [Paralvinella palmiformis]